MRKFQLLPRLVCVCVCESCDEFPAYTLTDFTKEKKLRFFPFSFEFSFKKNN